MPGGTQALHRTELIDVHLGDLAGYLPRPNLLGAILLTARAIDVDDARENQLQDLTFLLGLVEDPRSLSEQLTTTERTWLRQRKDLLERSARAWRTVANAEDGYRALRLLAGL